MKKTIILFILILVLVTLTSCSKPKKDNHFSNMDSKTFSENVTLPEKLSIDINLDDIKNIDKAKTYKADYVEFDKQKLIDVFIKNEVTEEKIWAEGPQIIASAGNIEEFLNIYDGGKGFGTKTDMEGGFTYGKHMDDRLWQKADIVANPSFRDPDFNVQKYGYGLNSDYASRVDLDFLSYEASLTDIKKILDNAEVPEFDIDETYSLDLETMRSHYKLYLNNELIDDETRNLNWNKEDESYIFSLRQLVDNIPIVNDGWQMPDGTKNSAWGNLMPATSINLIYDKTGIREIGAHNILKVMDEVENNSLINIYEALNTLIESYSLTILEDDVSIISAELCYLSIPKDNVIELVPGWVFRSAKAEMIDGKACIEYKYDVVNAVTGKLYQDRW
jgi:hypothetical protein